MCFLAVFVVYVCVAWPFMMDSEIASMENPATDCCGFIRWTFMPPLKELSAVHRLLITKNDQNIIDSSRPTKVK